MIFDAVLYIATGVGGCWWPIYDRDVLMDVTFWKFSNNPPNSVSMAYAITSIIILHSKCSRQFGGGIDCIGVFDFGPRKKYPLALLCASGSEM